MLQQRVAFILNANAKRVNNALVGRLMDLVPAGDLYFSKSMSQSEMFLEAILAKKYTHIFSGGGDGTFMNLLNSLKKIAKKKGVKILPKIGILKLGTGNALASVLSAKNAKHDIAHVVEGRDIAIRKVPMVKCDDGTATPFAGVGCDGELINDYSALKKRTHKTAFAPIVNSVLGYLIAGLGITLPRRLLFRQPIVKIIANKACDRVKYVNGKVEKERYEAGEILFHGSALVVTVGSVPFCGYNFKMFPFMGESTEHVQLRVVACHPLTIISKLYPSIWRGTASHPLLFDFLVEDVTIESDMPLPFQVGGDACGHKRSARFKVDDTPVSMAYLANRKPGRGLFSGRKLLAN